MFFLCWAPEVCDKRGVIRVFSLLSPGSLRQAGRNSCFFSAEPRKFPTSGAKSTFFFYYVPKINPSAMSHAIHKIVSIKRCQSYFISRRSPHLGISEDSESCASAHRCLHYAYARLIARVTFQLIFRHSRFGRLPIPLDSSILRSNIKTIKGAGEAHG